MQNEIYIVKLRLKLIHSSWLLARLISTTSTGLFAILDKFFLLPIVGYVSSYIGSSWCASLFPLSWLYMTWLHVAWLFCFILLFYLPHDVLLVNYICCPQTLLHF